jgi:hypothetical protein
VEVSEVTCPVSHTLRVQNESVRKREKVSGVRSATQSECGQVSNAI